MPKPPRLLGAGMIYHVYSEGFRGEPLFLDDADRLAWITLMREARERFSARFHAYCLTPGQIHMVVKTLEPNLAQVMEWLKRSYVRRFNARHGRYGNLFGGRYKSRTTDAAWLPKLVRYVHRTAVDPAFSSQGNYDGTKNDPLVEVLPIERAAEFMGAVIPKAEWKKLDAKRNGGLSAPIVAVQPFGYAQGKEPVLA